MEHKFEPKDIVKFYIENKGIHKTKFAKDIGVSYQFLWLFLTGDRNIGADTAIAIERATRGEIKKEWLIFPEDYRKEIEAYLLSSQFPEKAGESSPPDSNDSTENHLTGVEK